LKLSVDEKLGELDGRELVDGGRIAIVKSSHDSVSTSANQNRVLTKQYKLNEKK